MSINRLSRRESRQVEDFITNNKGTIDEMKLSMAEAAERATKLLGFAVTKSNIFNTAKAVGFQWPTKVAVAARARVDRGGTPTQNTDRLAIAIENLAAAVMLIAEQLTKNQGAKPQ